MFFKAYYKLRRAKLLIAIYLLIKCPTVWQFIVDKKESLRGAGETCF